MVRTEGGKNRSNDLLEGENEHGDDHAHAQGLHHDVKGELGALQYRKVAQVRPDEKRFVGSGEIRLDL